MSLTSSGRTLTRPSPHRPRQCGVDRLLAGSKAQLEPSNCRSVVDRWRAWHSAAGSLADSNDTRVYTMCRDVTRRVGSVDMTELSPLARFWRNAANKSVSK